jgi:valyl-tRNA synthetase
MAEKTLAKGYEPADVEARWRDHWEENKTFTPDIEADAEPYSIVIPPPNVTGALHIGHALNHTLQDILCRYQRQQGKKVLWVPGMDHAGIATQNVVERQLQAEGKSRDDLGREAFIERVWEWKEEYGGRIMGQIRMLGDSVDWTRERFTMDEGLSRAVREVFVRLYDEGLIYKGDYIVNWCTRCTTALADDEVEHAPRQSKLHHLRYPLADGSGRYVVVATTRPETMLGDTAVAVHPDDERYAFAHGQYVELPLTGRKIPVITDEYVDTEFGTGCLKITPAHDMNDFLIGEKHQLPLVRVIDDEGNMNAEAGTFQGLSREEARKRIMDELEKLDLVEKVEDYDHSVGHCYRCKTVIEPNVSPQWFVSVKPLAEKARRAVEMGETQIYPASWTKVYYDWLDNIRDWCISRQIWWGHRIPVYHCQDCQKTFASVDEPQACPCGGPLTQEEDVLDTWFSSALWPFSTMGWPEKTRELEIFYPTSVLVTAFDILFFWVARMMMMGIHVMGQAPFADVYIHALVRDEEGKKMSKSTGNVIDPLDMIDKYGCDALRFTLCAFAAMGRDIKLSEARIEGYRHFVNKLWNAARFALMNLPDDIPDVDVREADGLAHRWILDRVETVKAEVSDAIEAYRFNDAAQTLYAFIWHEFCDWYLEMIKLDMNEGDERTRALAQKTLWTVLTETITLLHPIMPFVTREIWEYLPGVPEAELALAPFPEARPDCLDESVRPRMELFQNAVVAVRNIRAELNINPSLPLTVLVKTGDEQGREFLLANAELIKRLARVGEIEAEPDVAAPKASASAVIGAHELYVPLEGAVDFEAELARLDKEEQKLIKDIEIASKKLSNEDFVAKAPANVVGKERERLAEASDKQEKIASLRKRIMEVMG